MAFHSFKAIIIIAVLYIDDMPISSGGLMWAATTQLVLMSMREVQYAYCEGGSVCILWLSVRLAKSIMSALLALSLPPHPETRLPSSGFQNVCHAKLFAMLKWLPLQKVQHNYDV